MSIPLIIGLISLLLILIIGYNVIIQYRQRLESAKQQELAKQVAIIDATEELISNASHLPYSKELLVCLNKRILYALETIAEVDTKDRSLKQRIHHVNEQLTHLETHFDQTNVVAFQVPNSDRQAIGMLQLVKRLKNVLKGEHSKGRIATQAYVLENTRLDNMQLRINIENVVKRANDARLKRQFGTAKQLLKKGIDVLSSRNDAYATKAQQKLQYMLNEIDNNMSVSSEQERQQLLDKDNDELDVLFQPKRKW
ncbi:DNA repair protein [Photobacterium phosphoreum]|uniref:DNA repair protein n=1 Tax=Photobacterium phosphoreum TaxID=659 RepID=A0A2T3K6I7_PHOPO|nr:DNA repair protein [Photobacterium phosphoreum]PSU27420.1 DNA repair protein [Photobacterium phosphoreum]PSU43962.1 DNA repair protein [Photobacterium phosphoreum]PSU54304.1 DNA repair protein [Photobacterium phosphoreum]PSU71869.1 DNA repair protein [Photobacterium phosphoreum]PSU82164.1 DNA repair protein [Photobacterium phosphoreum]